MIMEEDFSKKPKKKKNILFKRSFDDSILKKISEEIADDDERVLKEIDMMTKFPSKIKMKRTDPTIEEAMSFIMLR